MQEGTVVGEVGWYLGQPRSASVVAETPTVIHRLSSEGAAAMSREDPAGASAFHAFMARLLAERLAEANRAVEGLSE
jgi:SulP family sulfate permease